MENRLAILVTPENPHHCRATGDFDTGGAIDDRELVILSSLDRESPLPPAEQPFTMIRFDHQAASVPRATARKEAKCWLNLGTG
jgi:hypothetical protein